jgi:hypothetical protein
MGSDSHHVATHGPRAVANAMTKRDTHPVRSPTKLAVGDLLEQRRWDLRLGGFYEHTPDVINAV